MHGDAAHDAGPQGHAVEREGRRPAGFGRAERAGGRRDESRGDGGCERREGERRETHVDPETRHRQLEPDEVRGEESDREQARDCVGQAVAPRDGEAPSDLLEAALQPRSLTASGRERLEKRPSRLRENAEGCEQDAAEPGCPGAARHVMTQQDDRSARETHEHGGDGVDQLDENEDSARTRPGDAELAMHEAERSHVAAPERNDLNEEVRGARQAERPDGGYPLVFREQAVQARAAKNVGGEEHREAGEQRSGAGMAEAFERPRRRAANRENEERDESEREEKTEDLLRNGKRARTRDRSVSWLLRR